jgi:NCAIR mutase (PurE)-related protein
LDSTSLRALLESVRSGQTDVESAADRLAELPFIQTANARIDTHRALRQGIPEVVYGGEKTPGQIVESARALRQAGQDVLVTRVESDKAARVLEILPEAEHDALARVIWMGRREPEIQGKGTVLVISAGSADRPVASEAVAVARRFGNKVELLQDVGVAGLHRLLASLELIRSARVLIVVAGMEGALPSVVGGLVDKPVIAVPTSVGYGASLGGITALLGMLTSCASNVTTVNIDTGFGAAHGATLINRL